MKSIRNTILSLILILSGCTSYYYECEIGEADKADIPQTASVIDVPYSYVLVQTKFQPGMVRQENSGIVQRLTARSTPQPRILDPRIRY